LVEATLSGGMLEFAGFRVPVAREGAGRVVVGIRPEAFEDAALADPSLPQIEVTVEVVEDLGPDTHVIFPVDAPPLDVARDVVEDDEALLPEDRAMFTARVDPATSARPGERLLLAVDPAKFHFFDSATGARLDVAREAALQA